MAIQRHTVKEDTNSAIYGETANINYFLKTDLTPDSADGAVNVSQSVKEHPRRKYKGSATTTVESHSRTVLYDPGRRNGSATPGQQMILSDGTETRQFTYTGPWIEIHAYLVGNAKMDLSAYSASARYEIAAVGEGLARSK